MRSWHTLILCLAILQWQTGKGQTILCPGETVQFELEGVYYGDKTWEFSENGIDWSEVSIIEEIPFTIQVDQSGMYRVRFYDSVCDISYTSPSAEIQLVPVDDINVTLTTAVIEGENIQVSLDRFDELLDIVYYINGVPFNSVSEISSLPAQDSTFQIWATAVDVDSECLLRSDTLEVFVAPQWYGTPATVNVYGQVLDEFGTPVQDAIVRGGFNDEAHTVTDAFGVFLLENVLAYSTAAFVTVHKDGFFPGSRTFVPAQPASALHPVRIDLLKKEVTAVIDAGSGGTIIQDNVTVEFFPGSFLQGGIAHTGEVHVSIKYLDPTNDQLYTQMPGMLVGVMEDQPQLMYSFGMMAIEIKDSENNELILAPGSPATVTFPIAAEQLIEAPSIIPLWYFDEGQGIWIQEGHATRDGSEYIAELNHFSFWNWDVPSALVALDGIVTEQGTSIPLVGAHIKVVSPTMGSGSTFTNSQGQFAGFVPQGQELDLIVESSCATGDLEVVHSQSIGPFQTDASLNIVIPSILTHVQGTVVGCDGIPITSGYVIANEQIYYCTNGQFSLGICGQGMELRGIDQTNDRISDLRYWELTAPNMVIDTIHACSEVNSVIADGDGNKYPTVLIAGTVWMSENLRTRHYSNGDEIPNIEIDIEWQNDTIGAWCHYNNDSTKEVPFGKLYSGYTVTDPRNVCPIGWHVPDNQEWELLSLFMDPTTDISINQVPSTIAGGKMKATGTLQSGTGLWREPNTDASNDHSWTGLPGHARSSTGSFNTFNEIGSYGVWWSSTPQNGVALRTYIIRHQDGELWRLYKYFREGNSIRCVQD